MCRPDRRVDHTTFDVLGLEVNRNGGLRIGAGCGDVLLVLALCRERLTGPEATLQDYDPAFRQGDHRR